MTTIREVLISKISSRATTMLRKSHEQNYHTCYVNPDGAMWWGENSDKYKYQLHKGKPMARIAQVGMGSDKCDCELCSEVGGPPDESAFGTDEVEHVEKMLLQRIGDIPVGYFDDEAVPGPSPKNYGVVVEYGATDRIEGSGLSLATAHLGYWAIFDVPVPPEGTTAVRLVELDGEKIARVLAETRVVNGDAGASGQVVLWGGTYGRFDSPEDLPARGSADRSRPTKVLSFSDGSLLAVVNDDLHAYDSSSLFCADFSIDYHRWCGILRALQPCLDDDEGLPWHRARAAYDAVVASDRSAGSSVSKREKMSVFARSFPTLRPAPGVEPWDEYEFLRWAVGPRSHGERLAAAFVLSVWDPLEDWVEVAREEGFLKEARDARPELFPLIRFYIHEAYRCWDDEHRAAFLAWAKDPWWP